MLSGVVLAPRSVHPVMLVDPDPNRVDESWADEVEGGDLTPLALGRELLGQLSVISVAVSGVCEEGAAQVEYLCGHPQVVPLNPGDLHPVPHSHWGPRAPADSVEHPFPNLKFFQEAPGFREKGGSAVPVMFWPP